MVMSNLTPVELNRKYAVACYLLYAFFSLFAMLEYISYELYFYIPLFGFFILAHCLGSYTAIKYRLAAETRILVACIVIAGMCFSANIYLLFKLNAITVCRIMILMTLNILWSLYRLQCVRWLLEKAKKITGGRDGV